MMFDPTFSSYLYKIEKSKKSYETLNQKIRNVGNPLNELRPWPFFMGGGNKSPGGLFLLGTVGRISMLKRYLAITHSNKQS